MGDYVHVRQVPLEAISGYMIPLKLESCGCKSPNMDAGNQIPALWKGHRLEDEIRKQYLFSASKKTHLTIKDRYHLGVKGQKKAF